MIQWLFVVSGCVAFAQAPAPVASPTKEIHDYGLMSGVLLPSAVPDFYPVTTLYGFKYTFRGYDYPLEVGLLSNTWFENSSGLSYYNAFLTIHGETPFNEFFSTYGFGLDLTYHKGDTGQTFTTPGFHLQGGLMLPVYGSVWCQPEVRMGFNPGNTVFIGVSLVYRSLESGATKAEAEKPKAP